MKLSSKLDPTCSQLTLNDKAMNQLDSCQLRPDDAQHICAAVRECTETAVDCLIQVRLAYQGSGSIKHGSSQEAQHVQAGIARACHTPIIAHAHWE